MALLWIWTGPSFLFTTTVSRTFDEVYAGDGWESLKILDREYSGPLYETVQQELMIGGVDVWNTGMVTLEV